MTNTTRNRVDPGAVPAAVLALLLALLTGAAAPARAVDLALPGNARETAREDATPDSLTLATGPFAGGALPALTLEGAVSRAAWRVEAQGITTLQLLAPLRDQLASAGFETLFECEAASCGGFDFRYSLAVFPAPAMHVDLFDFRYLSARRGPDQAAEHVALLVSRSASAGFIQIVAVAPSGPGGLSTSTGGAPTRPASGAATPTPQQPGTSLPLATRLESQGRAVLSDLTFETGSSSLGEGRFASLADLAAFLKADPSRRVALVGHTDTVGSLDGNIALSKRRAASVLERLVSAHGAPRAQLEAEGMGYLAPLATNLTAAGREANRRVEVILLNTE